MQTLQYLFKVNLSSQCQLAGCRSLQCTHWSIQLRLLQQASTSRSKIARPHACASSFKVIIATSSQYQPAGCRRLQCTPWYDILPDNWNQELRDVQGLAMWQRKTLILCGALSPICKASPLQCLPLGPLKMILDEACGPGSTCAVLGALNSSL